MKINKSVCNLNMYPVSYWCVLLESSNHIYAVSLSVVELCQLLFRNGVIDADCFGQPNYDYRKAVKKAVPQVQYLDDEPLLDSERQHLQHASEFDEDWKLIDELVQEGMVMPEEKLDNMPGISFVYNSSNVWKKKKKKKIFSWTVNVLCL